MLCNHVPNAYSQTQKQRNSDDECESVARPLVLELQRVAAFERIVLVVVQILLNPSLPVLCEYGFTMDVLRAPKTYLNHPKLGTLIMCQTRSENLTYHAIATSRSG